MPIYEYQCEECEHIFERIQSISKSKKGGPCPKCSSKKTNRQLSVFATGNGRKADTSPSSAMNCAPTG